ncbi:hypothetical protein KQI61_07715 [Anaerocolumna aminovalerica]|uniref:hypothetical protein n=1 Tax=Anaerocolumna aminovalerica TaxID=1527 RepID=UPI001C0F330F|nr:hypothetical protein [Anaerocolumna aminovalerica]MBU5332083.1 hypothetical protein [Anaerocolumna aminovalerica]
MDNVDNYANLRRPKYGDGKSIIEILSIGFEPLLTKKEYTIYKKIGLIKKKIYYYEKSIKIINSCLLYLDDFETRYHWLLNHLNININKLKKCKDIQKYAENIFRNLLIRNIDTTRKIYDDRCFKNEDQFRKIAIFESDLTRCFGCKDMEYNTDIINVVTYYTEIFESIIHNGFYYNMKHYVFFTAGAGQTRNKKSTFVSEEKLEENFNRLFCGLTKEIINNLGGMNTNKFLAYTSLCQTNSEIWENFNIDKAIVVDDIEYEIPNQIVRYIYTETPEDKNKLFSLQNDLIKIDNEIKIIKLGKRKGVRRNKVEIEHEKELRDRKKRLLHEIEIIKSKYHKPEIKKMSVKIPFTDGFGISLKKTQSAMIRLPFIKGLIAYVPKKAFKNYCYNNNIKINKIQDIYGKYHSIDNIDYIFTKSQFKMYKYYQNILNEHDEVIKTGWEVYKENFKKYNCDACRCNVERKVKLNAKTNYQILQTLTTEMIDDEIKQLASYDIDNLNGIGNDIQSMLNILGANEEKNDNLSYLQKSLLLYPEMLKDFYLRTLIKNTKNSMINKFRSGKFNIEGSYTFVIPDTLACLQWWFTDERNLDKLGFLKENEVCCTLFESGEELDCLRSPHLDHAHCIRNNKNDNDTALWVKSKGVYVGVKDIMSKLLMYDNDGDKLLVHRNKTIINCAKRFQEKYGMIPNYYEMPKASPTELNNTTLYDGIVLAYHHGNIGLPSNEITKIFMTLNPESTEEDVKEAIEIVALRCVDVNFTIDYAKTLYKPTIPKQVLKRYKNYSKKNIPHFFIYAKGKKAYQVEPLGNCNIDRIYNIVHSKRIVFKDLLGKYSYKVLMNDANVDRNSEKAKEIVELYNSINEANKRKLSYINLNTLDIYEKKRVKLQLEFDSNKQRKEFIEYIGESKEYITDVLVKSLQNDINKDTLWKLFGDVIYENIKRNLEGTKICEVCGERFNYSNNKMKYCKKCSYEIQLDLSRKYKNKVKNNT